MVAGAPITGNRLASVIFGLIISTVNLIWTFLMEVVIIICFCFAGSIMLAMRIRTTYPYILKKTHSLTIVLKLEYSWMNRPIS